MPGQAATDALAAGNPLGMLGMGGGGMGGMLHRPRTSGGSADGVTGARLAGFKRRAREDAGGSSNSGASGEGAARAGPSAAAAGQAPSQRRGAANKHQVCSECGTDTTPTWRRNGPALLCNACGLRRRKLAAASTA